MLKQSFVVSGTDTDIGKTVFCAALVGVLDAYYYKPVQAGLDPPSDSDFVAQYSQVAAEKILPERYRLNTPASPHIAAEIDGIEITPEDLVLPTVDGPLVVEGAGGLMVPLNRSELFLDQFARWQLPVILCARTSLGTINHTLLSVAALKQAGVPIHGIAFIGHENKDSQQTIIDFSQVRNLGRLPWLKKMTPKTLRQAFVDNFDIKEFRTV